MDHSPVPFPTLSLQSEETHNTDTRPENPRIHSSPSLPNIWVPTQHGSAPPHIAQRLQARYRPHLRPLDLAAAPTTPTKSQYPSSGKRSTSGSPCRPAALLTPPLTPSSSFASNAHDGPSTPPEANSPLRWVHNMPDSPTALKGHTSLPHGGYLTPSSARSQSMSSDSGYATSSASARPDVMCGLETGLGSVDITPRDERQAVLGTPVVPGDVASVLSPLLDFGETREETQSSHFLLVRNIPLAAPSAKLKDVFASTGDVKGIWVRFQETDGIVILAYYDIRHAVRARRQISSQAMHGLEGVRLEAIFIAPEELEKMTGKSAFVDETDGTLYVSFEDRRFQPSSLQNVLSSFGELLLFEATEPQAQVYHVEFYDVRDAANAYRALNDRTFMGARLRLYKKSTQLESLPQPQAPSPYQSRSPSRPSAYSLAVPSAEASVQIDREMRWTEGRVRPRSVSASENMGAPDAVRRLRGRESPQEHSRRSSNDLFFDAVGKVPTAPQTPLRPRSISIGPDADDMTRPPRPYQSYDPSSYHYPGTATSQHGLEPMYDYQYAPQQYLGPTANGAGDHWARGAPPAPTVEYYIPPSPRSGHNPSALPPSPRRPQRNMQRSDLSPVDGDGYPRYSPSSSTRPHIPRGSSYEPSAVDGRMPSHTNSNNMISEKNQLNIEAIESGKDMRTTVMIKNIPNKMSDKDLLTFIAKVCPRRIDFLYLRMDFQNGCNVGYAFVNFITVGDLLHFARTQLGVKWNMYSSEKVLQMCYATYQGKEALVEKFKNSCIMDERESWRPKIFYSDGPNQGLSEPFPPPTHLRRKERSSHNRGALFVPGSNYRGDRRDGNGGSTLYHHRPEPPRMAQR
ncbi:RNA recognition motif 2-domain-containing protein [Rhodofomes roseus]|uniref:RNA recognition motif 2-domain-containing protein n=1 Tax=Rhodofomes roseus TaxID=34475 RepID=A0ABQ8K5R0_9APHY|nr:RNA recognition motif 2-domain-containing protein [Rhodofomes roseus]KAH9832301.1 RNA recognition motif 2-domain-containing protein [Rhodofomes roseus]